MKPRLEIRLIGELEVARAGDAEKLPASRKTRALLGYLVATGRPHLRERLCELLWDGPDDPRAALRWSLTKLRKHVDEPPAGIVGDRSHAGFSAEGSWVDLIEARTLIGTSVGTSSTDALRSATALLRGELMEGLDLPDCYRFHEWLLAEREAVRSLRVAVLAELVERLRQDHPEEALRHARAWLAIDPLDEAAHAAAARVLTALGRRPDAVAQIRTARRRLESELGTRPSWVLESARLDLAAPPAAPVAIDPLQPPRGALRGRDDELALVARHVADAVAGQAPGLLLLAGEPGIGKSRLLEEVRAQVDSRGGLSLAGRGYEAEQLRPYGAFIDAFRTLSGERLQSAPPELSRLLPELGTCPPISQDEGDRGRLFEVVVTTLRALGRAAPVALVIDDVQWLDEGSAALLHYVTRALSADGTVIACAVRPAELGDNRAASRTLRALVRDGRVRSIELGPLGEEATLALVRSAGAVDAPAVCVRSGGNPFFALELARAQATAGDETVPASLTSMLAARFERLSPGARGVLAWAAALGRTFDAELLARTSGSSGEAILAALTELEEHDVVRASSRDGGRSFDFSHDLVRSAAYQALSEPRRRMIHLHLARALAAQADADGALAVDVAHHASRGGEPELAARACAAAAQRCLQLFAADEAESLALRGLAQVEQLSEDVRTGLTIQLLHVRARVAGTRRRAAEIERALEISAEQAASRGLHDDAALGYHALTVLRFARDDHTGAERGSLLAATAARASDPVVAARTLANAGCCLAELERQPTQARALLAEARSLGDLHEVEIVDVWLGQGLLAAMDGDEDGGTSLIERGLTIAEAQQDAWRRFWALRRLALLDLDRTRHHAAIARAKRMFELASRTGDGSEAAIARAIDALGQLGAGAADGEARLEGALEDLRTVDAKWMLGYALLFAADRAVSREDRAAAEAHATLALTAAETLGRANLMARARAVLGACALLAGDAAAAQRHAQAAAAALTGAEAPSARTRAALDGLARRAGLESWRLPTKAPTNTRHAASRRRS
jgi:predicted ATPase/DNA-binding SARP family transcriptional activator